RRQRGFVEIENLEIRQLLSTAASFTSANYTANQNGTAAVLTVQLTGDVPTSEVDVYYNTADNTAKAGTDYVAESGTLAFPAGTTSEQLLIPVLNSQSLGSNKDFYVELTDPYTDLGGNATTAPYVLISPSTADVTIQNVNSAFQIAPATVSVNDDQQTATITVQRLGVTSDEETVDFSTVFPANANIGTEATPGANYDTVLTTLDFQPGETSKTVQIPILYDANNIGPTENVLLQLSNPQVVPPGTGSPTAQNLFLLGSPNSSLPAGTGLLSIRNVDAAPPVIQNLTLNSTGKHIDSITIQFSKDLSQASADAITSYGIFNRNHDGPYATGQRSGIKLESAFYDVANDTVVLTPKHPLHMNKIYQFVAYGTGGVVGVGGHPVQGNGTNPTPGSNYSTFFGMGNRLRYADSDGDIVKLKLAGPGLLDLRRAFDGDASSLVLENTTTDSILSGKVIQRKHGDGQTTIDLLGSVADVDNTLTKPPFNIVELT
ncbi:MAG TPA: Calx-beta domain-containing protein, partial [Tepidisphaeraceae bacterium]|nr:Calx-beta domain-containing protein [Tepidisphaeraceae bacterium]